MPPHHPASNQTPRESRACQLGQLASSPAKNRQAQEHGASSRAWRREGGCPEKCTPCPVCRWVTGALTVDGILGSILPRSSPASEHLFFFDDDMALRSLRVLDLVSSEWRQHFVRFEFFWSPDTQTRSFFHLAPGSGAVIRDTPFGSPGCHCAGLLESPLPSPLPFSPLRHEPLVCRACFLYMMHEPRSPTKSTRMGQWTRPDDGQAMRSATGGQ